MEDIYIIFIPDDESYFEVLNYIKKEWEKIKEKYPIHIISNLTSIPFYIEHYKKKEIHLITPDIETKRIVYSHFENTISSVREFDPENQTLEDLLKDILSLSYLPVKQNEKLDENIEEIKKKISSTNKKLDKIKDNTEIIMDEMDKIYKEIIKEVEKFNELNQNQKQILTEIGVVLFSNIKIDNYVNKFPNLDHRYQRLLGEDIYKRAKEIYEKAIVKYDQYDRISIKFRNLIKTITSKDKLIEYLLDFLTNDKPRSIK